MNARIFPVPLASILILSGCSEKPEKGLETVEIEIEAFTVEPGEEITRCQVVHLENDEAFDFNRVSSVMTPGSHHLFVYADASNLAPGQTPPPEGFGPCDMEALRLPVYPAQEPVHEAVMPSGVAGQLRRNSILIIEAHYINATTEPVTAHATITFDPADPDTIEHYSGFFMAMDIDFSIPPGAGINGAPAYVSGATCAVPEELKVYRLGSHGHKRLEKFEIFHDDGSGEEKLYENTNWSEPVEVDYPDGAPLQVAAGQEFRFGCTWTNETDQAIEFGSSVEDEMCIMGVGYYPRVSGPYNLGGVIFCLNGEIYY